MILFSLTKIQTIGRSENYPSINICLTREDVIKRFYNTPNINIIEVKIFSCNAKFKV